MGSKDVGGIANSVDPDQTEHSDLGLSENLGSLWYSMIKPHCSKDKVHEAP